MKTTIVRVLFVLLLVVLGCSGTQRQVQARGLDVLARTANAALPVLVERYQAEGDRAIDAAPTVEAAKASLAEVRSRWAVVWAAWAQVRAAEDAYAAVLEAEAEPSPERVTAAREALGGAYCTLRRLPAASGLPDMPGGSCGP